MSRKSIIAFCFMLVAGLFVCLTDSQAMPNFARKYSADCSMCHTQIPKLNRIGYEFRLAGYRLPSEIGKDEKPFNLGDFFAARIQEQYTYDRSTPVTGSSVVKSQLEFFEVTLYPLSGSWGKNFASLVELSMAPDETFETENAYVRGVSGDENGWFEARIGIMHPWEGFGASDRPLGNNRPLIQKLKATGSPFILWNLDQSGIEAGYYHAKTGTTISANIWNGITKAGEPAQGGGLTKTPGDPGYNDKDFQIFLNQFINDDSSVSLYYYRGVVPFPATGTSTRDDFDRFTAYINYWAVKQTLNLLAGYGTGKESLGDSTVTGGGNVGKSDGFFVEADYHPMLAKLGVGVRYDEFDPSDKTGNDKSTAESIFANYYVTNGLQFIADYRHKEDEVPAGGKKQDNQLTARMIFIW